MSSTSTSNPTVAVATSSSNKTSKISPPAAFAKMATVSSSTKPGASQAPSPRRLTLNQATRAQMDATFRDTGRPRPVALTGLFGLSTCNSGFLSSLLADVAKAKEEILQAKRASSSSSASPSVKRRRISLENTNTAKTEQTNKPLQHAPKNLLQEPCHILDLLWEESWLAPPVLPPAANALPANQVVPRANIPATVSDAALEEQPQPQEAASVQATRMATEDDDDDDEDNFGWFVDMDEDSAPSSDTTATTTNAMICDDSHRYHWQQQPPSVSSQAMSSDSLAFSAPIAPKASNYDAELEWAKAADTVDDVLGDLF